MSPSSPQWASEARIHGRIARARIGPLRRRAFPGRIELLERFLAEIGVREPHEIEEARRQHCLASSIFRSLRDYTRLPPARQAVWLEIGEDVEPVLRGGALLAGSHFGCGMLTPLALSRFGVEVLAIVRASRGAYPSLPGLRVLDLREVSPLRASAAARETLLRHGVVFLAADVPVGRGADDVEVDVLGRRRTLPRGFATLSVTTGVPATPVFSRVEASGRIVTWLEPPLAAPVAGEVREKSEALTRSYARVLSATFSRHPGNVTPPAIRLFLQGRRAAPAPPP